MLQPVNITIIIVIGELYTEKSPYTSLGEYAKNVSDDIRIINNWLLLPVSKQLALNIGTMHLC